MIKARNISPALLRGWPLPLPQGGDKNARGAVFIVGGSPCMPGAVLLSATAALRAGAGKLQIGTCASVAPFVAIAMPEALVTGLEESDLGSLRAAAVEEIVRRANSADALVLGPGMMDEKRSGALASAVLRRLQKPVVVDAAALACFSKSSSAEHPAAGCVLTPHAGEMAHMLGVARDEIESDPARHAIGAARLFGSVVALKGQETYIADPTGALYRNANGHIGLATSGSGDTLAGIIGGLLARGCEPLAAAVWGVYLHAAAGSALARRIGIGFLAREVPAEIPQIMARYRPKRTPKNAI